MLGLTVVEVVLSFSGSLIFSSLLGLGNFFLKCFDEMPLERFAHDPDECTTTRAKVESSATMALASFIIFLSVALLVSLFLS